MKIVIASVNSKFVHASPSPWCLKEGLKKYSVHKHSVGICEGTVNEEIDILFNKIKEEEPQLVGFCCYIWNIGYVFRLAKLIKEALGCIVVFGGPEVTFNSKCTLKDHTYVDYVVCGEGEVPFAKLCDALEIKKTPVAIDGISYRSCGEIVISKPYLPRDNSFAFDLTDYCESIDGRIAYIETSRGCPFSCAFCLSSSLGKTRFCDLDTAFKNIIQLAQSSARTVKFVDRTFNVDRNRSKAIFQFILNNYGTQIPKDKTFHFEIAGDILDDETIDILRGAPKGLFRLEIGMQSFNEQTLKAVNRKTNTKKLIENINKLSEGGNLILHIDLIAGLPLEDLDSFSKSFNIGFSLGANELQLGFLKLLHGAAMREDHEKYPCVYSKTAPYEVTSTQWLSATEINLIKCCESSLERLCNSGRFPLTNDYLFKCLKLDPFETLTALGIFTGTKSIPLYSYVNLLYLFFETLCDKNKLRDCLLCDLFSAVCSEQVPKLLQCQDKRLKCFKNFLERDPLTKRKKNIKRRMFILYSKNQFAYVDYKNRDNDGRFKINYFDIEEIFK